MPKHLISIADLERSDVMALVNRGLEFANSNNETCDSLRDKFVGIYFRQTSTRTRTSFTVAAARLGATAVVLGPQDLQLNTGESMEDTGKVLSGYLDALVVRSAERHTDIMTLAKQKRMAVINAMSVIEHPTQALADFTTLKQHFGRLEGLRILYFGEGNNTAVALALAVSKVAGMKLTIVTPKGYGLDEGFVERVAKDHDGQIEQRHSLDNLPHNVDVVYTTRWQTTGTSKKDPDWRSHFEPFRVTPDIMSMVSTTETVFMHDLPAVRGEDVSAEVIDGPQSIVFQQAKNKLFGAMAVLEWCIAN